MLDPEKLKRQRQRLAETSNQEWAKANKALAQRLLKRLGGRLEKGEHGETILVGGHTKYGAHSEKALGSNALHYYQTVFFEKLADGDWEWPEDRSLSEQMEMMVDSVVRHGSEKEDRRKKKADREAKKAQGGDDCDEEFGSHIIEFTPRSQVIYADFEGSGAIFQGSGSQEDDPSDCEVDEPTVLDDLDGLDDIPDYDGPDHQHWLWETLCEAVESDPELKEYVQTVGECREDKEVRQRLGLKDGDRDKLVKRMKRRVNKQ